MTHTVQQERMVSLGENNNQLLTDELKEFLKKHQLEWIDKGDLWSKGFVQGIEYMLKKTGEYNESIYK